MTDAGSLERALVPPPEDLPDICPLCRSWRRQNELLCDNCADNKELLGDLAPLIPISLYRKPSLLRDWLTYYKPNDEADHPEYGAIIGAIFDRWIRSHGAALRSWCGGFKTICVVPSAARPPPHPLEAVIDAHVDEFARDRAQLLYRADGTLAHRTPSRSGYMAKSNMRGHRVLLIDDVYTTGARSQSAAHALRAAEAIVPAILVIGRRVNPDWRPEVAAIWKRQATIRFRFEDSPWWRRD